MTPRHLPALLACLVVLGASAGVAWGRYEFRVTGVGAGDTLNMRQRIADPDEISSAPIVGRIPPRATGVVGSGASQVIGRNRWYEVRYGSARGWVNGRFLEPLSRKVDGELGADLFCAGTEPFWSLKIDQTAASLTRPDSASQRFTVAAREPLEGRVDTLAVRLVSEDRGDLNVLVQHKEWCSDGASDLDYAFEARVVGDEAGAKPLRGCCSLVR